MIPGSTDDPREFHPPRTLTPEQLGDDIARLVWESFSDFITEGNAETLLGEMGVNAEDGLPTEHAAEEMLIFFLWAHTRGVQQAFLSRTPDDLIREGLDHLHAAVFEDMVSHGTPAAQLPIFEQRVSARYSEYYHAAESSDLAVGTAVIRHLTRKPAQPDVLARALADQAISVANPLRDFLEDVDLVQA